MSTYVQQERPLQVTTTLGADKFLLAGIQGHEGISTPFHFRLDLRSEDGGIDGSALLRKPVSVTIETPDSKTPRRIHGLVSRFVQLGERDDLASYAVEIVPWLWFLSLRRNCRIFQHKSVPQILQQVFGDAGNSDYRLALQGSYRPREYCVQYRETDLDFLCRLMEEEGIFYSFEHQASKHMLVLHDMSTALPVCPGMASAELGTSSVSVQRDVVLSFACESAVHAGKSRLRDYNFEVPGNPWDVQVPAVGPGGGPEEAYDYPGGHGLNDPTNIGPEGSRLVRIRMEAEEALQQVMRAESTLRALQAGTTFALQRHYRADANKKYLILEATISAKLENFRAWDGHGFEYRNQFLAIPASVPYRPPCRTPRPTIPGTQTALVVGKSGEEIWTDKYGRVKVQFHWDRLGKKDENSSCWVRVASGWAGKGWGAIQIPRIGQEVVVAFLDGDPDRPLVVGSVYNAELMAPYALPDNQTQSGVKSRSSKGGAPANYNEIRLEDKKGSEQISVQAEKDLTTLVKHDETRTVQHDRSTIITNDEKRTVKEGDDTTTIEKGDQTLEVSKGDQLTTIGEGDQTVEVKQGKQTITVGQGDQVIEVKGGKQRVSVKGTQEIDITDGDQKTTLHKGKQAITLDKGNQEVTLQMGDCVIKLGKGNFKVNADLGKVQLEGMQGIELKVGQSKIVVDQKGVTIKGLKISVAGDLATEIKGLKLDVTGDAMHKGGGGITMLG